MCDTMLALANATADGSVLFAKNSDRDPNEAHQLLHVPACTYPPGSFVQCTYISIPQVKRTHAVLLSKPFWIWGAEMGANEHGVVIGNEAVFTRVPQEKEPALLGMDLLRLALERSTNAYEALKEITSLLEKYGQGGNCGFSHKMVYHNSFLIGDQEDGWVLETAGREWAAVRVHGVRSISNAITITNFWDLASPGLVEYAIRRGWCRSRDDFDFSRCYSEPVFTNFGAGRYRQACSSRLLKAKEGSLTLADMMSFLRYHGEGAEENWRPDGALFGSQVCMHYGFGPVRINQTTGSMVSQMKKGESLHWFTGTAAPCTSIFKPVWIDAGLPAGDPDPVGTADDASLWWRHERLHRSILEDYPARQAAFAADRDALERDFVNGAEALPWRDVKSRLAYSTTCFQMADQAEQKWHDKVKGVPTHAKNTFYYRSAWRNVNRQAGLTK